MCLFIFIRISAVTLRGLQFYRNNKSTKIKKIYVARRIIRFVYYSAPLGFGIAEYNDQPLIEKKIYIYPGGWGAGVCLSVPENARESRKMKSIVPDLSEKIMACMLLENFWQFSSTLKVSSAHSFSLGKKSIKLCDR